MGDPRPIHIEQKLKYRIGQTGETSLSARQGRNNAVGLYVCLCARGETKAHHNHYPLSLSFLPTALRTAIPLPWGRQSSGFLREASRCPRSLRRGLATALSSSPEAARSMHGAQEVERTKSETETERDDGWRFEKEFCKPVGNMKEDPENEVSFYRPCASVMRERYNAADFDDFNARHSTQSTVPSHPIPCHTRYLPLGPRGASSPCLRRPRLCASGRCAPRPAACSLVPRKFPPHASSPTGPRPRGGRPGTHPKLNVNKGGRGVDDSGQ